MKLAYGCTSTVSAACFLLAWLASLSTGLFGRQQSDAAACRRYDGLVGMFSGKDIAAVGVSIGIERLFTVMASRMGSAARATHTQVLAPSDVQWPMQYHAAQKCSKHCNMLSCC